MNTMKKRLQVIVFTSLFIWFILIIRLVIIQIYYAAHYKALSLKMSEEQIELKPRRGNIYDRNGALLATDVDAESFFAVPSEIKNVQEVASVFNLYTGEPTSKIIHNLNKHTDFVWLSRRVEKGIADEIKAKKLEGIYALPCTRRIYPNNELAAHLLGFVGDDGIGLEGLERQYDDALAGQSGWTVLRKDARGNDHSFPDTPPQKPGNGNDLYLTLDVQFQEIVERELKAMVSEQNAKGGLFLLMNPQTGEILASAIEPQFNPNNASDYDNQIRRNRVVTDPYEPGSTFKFVTAAAALEERIMSPNTTIYCERGKFDLGIHEFHDSIEHGWLTFTQVIEKSSNVGVYKIAREVGPQKIYEYALRFGFGCESGSNLTGETKGMLRPPAQWSPLSIMAIPIGQEIAVTPLQLVNAFSVIANDGYLYEPQILSKMVDQNGEIVKSLNSKMIRQAISPQIAKILKEILTGVVERGTGMKAQIPGIKIAGKTGTAQKKLSGIEGYAPDTYISTFVGFLPADDAKLIALALIDEPHKDIYGGDIAAPLFRKVMERIIANRNITPYLAVNQEINTQDFKLVTDNELLTVKIKDWRGMQISRACDEIKKLGLLIQIEGNRASYVMAQSLLPGSITKKGSTIVVYADYPEKDFRMPTLIGKSLRVAKRELDRQFLNVRYVGSGVVEKQSPPPGTLVLPGEICRIFAKK